ncbi:P-loop containing nucleoside triphosphate hydrolase protein [Rickenella mellea]|uniref:Midasin n=1 Tax=Rickenella mellea TaxID=50990 RepID=A0A4Y7Q3U9_9AGAM|nr:P-loop containing nucleoside triphosphate hydrolase protein [Rickenella mellea]
MNDVDWNFPNPLSIDLRRQTSYLIESLPHDSNYADILKNASSPADLLRHLSRLLAHPSLTIAVEVRFRPLLLDLCVRWLDYEEHMYDKLEAFALLIEFHEELYPVMLNFLRHQHFTNGILPNVLTTPSFEDVSLLHRVLLAYYRILRANRFFPYDLYWDLSPLVTLFSTPHSDRGVCWLAIRCYALQSGMGDAEREKLEVQVLGEIGKDDCPVYYGQDIVQNPQTIDGWLLPVIELKRIENAREHILDSQDYYTSEESDDLFSLRQEDLSPHIVNIHGVLFHHIPSIQHVSSSLIETPSTITSLRKLAVNVSLRLPTLLTSSPSSGKSSLLDYLAKKLHPTAINHVVTIHLADTSLDPRSLLGSYVSSPANPGSFEWKEGAIVRAMREGKWLVLKDLDRSSSEILGLLSPLAESCGLGKRIGTQASITVPGRGTVRAAEDFVLFATRSLEQSRNGGFSPAAFLNAHKWSEVVIPSPSERDLEIIMDAKFPHMAGVIIRSIIALWRSIKGVQTSTSSRQVGLRNLESFALRLSSLLDSTILRTVKTDMAASLAVSLSDVIPHPAIREDIFLEARDVFFGEGTTSESSYARLLAVAAIVAENLGIGPERRDWVTTKPVRFDIEKDVDGRSKSVMVGRTKLSIWPKSNSIESVPSRPFTMHKPALHLFSRIATCISLCEPVLLTGETGTGKTSLVTHVAALLNRPLISLNLSTQTETSDLVGGFRPVDTRIPGFELQHRFTELFSDTFSVKKNGKFVETVRKAATNLQWRKAAKLWTESVRLALEKLPDPDHLTGTPKDDLDSVIPRKRQKLQDGSSHLLRSQWLAFERGLQAFEAVHIRDEGRVAFSFMEGPLVKALRTGTWVLLDEINLANPETLECLSSILQSSSSSITLTDQGALEPVPRHPEFRLFACMNPATDVGKKDLPSHLRARFTEIDVLPPDADRETLLSIISQYIGHCAVSDKAAVLDVAEFYTAVKELSFRRHLADGSNHRPHYSMRTLTRMLTFTSDIASMYGLRRALWEGCLMAFTMILDAPSEDLVLGLARRHLLSSVKNIKSTLAQMPSATQIQTLGPAIQFGPFWLEVGPFAPESADDYILTSSVQKKIVDLSRIIITRRFPVLIEGPTSSGKTSAVHYLARRTGHRFVRINNHEHTDLQEYLGSYVSDPDTGKLKFQDGLLVRALKEGDWIVLDELNLAPSDVLEALNRLLDDNRELFIPETNEVVKPHPHFMLFATQNPPGVYAGRKVLSRAFRNRFLEVHFDDVPQSELESILCQRCQIAPSYGQRIVSVFHELQNRRQAGRVFEGKHGFATLRDLFRWAQRDALSYQELAENGFMLLAERTRRQDDKTVVKEVIEKIMNVRIDEDSIYDPASGKIDITSYLGCHIPSNDAIVWTKGMRRLFILVSRALRFNEPVLLVGETGCGKTSVCQVYADATQKLLVTVNCHQNIEAADLIGGQRPVRQRKSLKSVVVAEAKTFLSRFGVQVSTEDSAELLQSLLAVQHSPAMTVDQRKALTDIQSKIQLSLKIFEWHDGPLVSSMREGDIFLLDEISLADDSVLERLNSVLEPTRAIVLAEKGGEDVRASQVIATEDFKLLATMNPGGDYGKKELSPALRNRFTEIWVPSVMLRADLEQIVSNMWNHDELRPLTNPLLDFTEWLCLRVGDDTLIGLRDIMAWVTFCNSVHGSSGLHPNVAFHHGAFMTLIDGLASFPTLSSRSQNALDNLKAEAITKLAGLVPISGMSLEKDPTEVSVSQSALKIGLFSIASGAHSSTSQPFNLNAPTSRLNAMRVIRACQLMKPILLEGSPGVGKTSLVAALAGSAGRNLRRINLSEQTDLVDLFGSDLPSASGELGEFSWKDATFLRALQNGDWVLLDEMNLAPQSVLEGLNAVLDHRGTVYIPELDRSFIRHPDFRIFAAQNPFHQGGGRKGLPKSFVNRFTKVYVDALSPDDMLLICRHLFPNLPTSILRQMIIFNSSLNDQAKAGKFDGGPWEFNLRDLIRWASLLQQVPRAGGTIRPDEFVDVVYGGFRRDIDRAQVRQLYKAAFGVPPDCTRPGPFLSKYHIQCGNCFIRRSNNSQYRSPETIFPAHLKGFQAALAGISQNWLIIVTGPHRSGKTAFVRSMAQFGGQDIQEISLNSATDTADLLGSFEQVDARYHIRKVLHDIRRIYEESLRRPSVTQPHQCYHLLQLRRVLRDGIQTVPVDQLVKLGWDALHSLPSVDPQTLSMFSSELERCRQVFNHTGSFEWIDGPLVRALKTGTWLVLDGVNLCSPSVLDRLNSLCESGGNLVLSERGDESQVLVPHNNFRIFMIVDPRHGELSRAMRNRGVEISLDDFNNQQSSERLLDIFRLPRSVSCDFQKSSTQDAFITFELTRRALKLGPVERRSTGSWTSNDLGAEDSLWIPTLSPFCWLPYRRPHIFIISPV